MSRVCTRCGGEIDDLSIHPYALTCETCRAQQRGINISPDLHDNVAVLAGHLSRNGWPKYAKAANIISDAPEVLDEMGLSGVGHQRAVWLMARCIAKVTTPDGGRYVKYAKSSTGITYVLTHAPQLSDPVACLRCREPISDISSHPTATLCPACRRRTMNSGGVIYQKYGHLFREYLARHNYPEYVAPAKILSLQPDLFNGLGLSQPGMIRVLGTCISEYRGPHGEQYHKYSRRFWRLSAARGQTQEATA